MKKMTFLLFMTALNVSCSFKTNKVSLEQSSDINYPDFVIDTALQRHYLEETMESSMPKDWNGEVSSAENAFKIAESILNNGFGAMEMAVQKPFSINLVNNEIWVIEGTLHQPEGEIVMGGTAYMEINKSDGKILKIIHGE